MNHNLMNKHRIARGALAAMLLASGLAQADCGRDQFYDPRDIEQKAPIARPHADFERTRRLAAQGVAAEERNLAAFYDTGYMVSMCREKARYWYSRAAERGDEYAMEWLDRHESLERLRKGPECFGDACFQNSRGPQKTVIVANHRGMFLTSVMINGKRHEGLIDTGATTVAMSPKLAQEIGIAYSDAPVVRGKTANGVVQGRAVKLATMTVGSITLKDVEAAVLESDVELLVGMSFLRRLNVNTSGNSMTLVKP